MIDRATILQEMNTLQPFPAYTRRMIELGCFEGNSPQEIIDANRTTETAFAEALKLANSPYFSQHPFSSLDDALTTLGPARCSQILLAAAVVAWSRHYIQPQDSQQWRLFDHCLAVGIGAERLCQELQRDPPNHLFLLGFLHDIGKVIFEGCLKIQSKPIIDLSLEKNIPVDEAERQLLGIDHMEAGAILLRMGHFPEEFIEVIRWHHLPDSLDPPPFALDLVHTADVLALLMGIGPESEGLNYRTSKNTETRLALRNRNIENVLCQLNDDMEQTSSLWKT